MSENGDTVFLFGIVVMMFAALTLMSIFGR